MLNVEALDSDGAQQYREHAGHRMCVLCFMPEGHLPVGDVMLAQKLALESFEAEAIKIAHMSPSLHIEDAEGVAIAEIVQRATLNGRSF